MEYRFFISALCILVSINNAISQSVIIADHSTGIPIVHVGVFSSDSLRFTYSDQNGQVADNGLPVTRQRTQRSSIVDSSSRSGLRPFT